METEGESSKITFKAIKCQQGKPIVAVELLILQCAPTLRDMKYRSPHCYKIHDINFICAVVKHKKYFLSILTETLSARSFIIQVIARMYVPANMYQLNLILYFCCSKET